MSKSLLVFDKDMNLHFAYFQSARVLWAYGYVRDACVFIDQRTLIFVCVFARIASQEMPLRYSQPKSKHRTEIHVHG